MLLILAFQARWILLFFSDPRAKARGNSEAIQRQFNKIHLDPKLSPDFELPPDLSGGIFFNPSTSFESCWAPAPAGLLF